MVGKVGRLLFFPGTWLALLAAGFEFQFCWSLFIWGFGIFGFLRAHRPSRSLRTPCAILGVVVLSVLFRQIAWAFTSPTGSTCAGPFMKSQTTPVQIVRGPGNLSVLVRDDACDPTIGFAGEGYVDRSVFVLSDSDRPNRGNLVLTYSSDHDVLPRVVWLDSTFVRIRLPSGGLEYVDAMTGRVGNIQVDLAVPREKSEPSDWIWSIIIALLF